MDVWDSTRWDDGYVDNRGRFRVKRPDCPRAYANGWALRAHLAGDRRVPPGQGCDCKFTVPGRVVAKRRWEGTEPKYCSTDCYQANRVAA